MPSPELVPAPLIESRIYFIRGEKVLLDADLAALYQVPTRIFNQAVKRKERRFPADLRFPLKEQEYEDLKSQIVISSSATAHGGRRYLPYAFTELGVAMLSSVLNSDSAIQMNRAIMRTFVRLRHILATHEDLARPLQERRWTQHDHAQQLQTIFEVLEQITAPRLDPNRRRIGYPMSSEVVEEPEQKS